MCGHSPTKVYNIQLGIPTLNGSLVITQYANTILLCSWTWGLTFYLKLLFWHVVHDLGQWEVVLLHYEAFFFPKPTTKLIRDLASPRHPRHQKVSSYTHHQFLQPLCDLSLVKSYKLLVLYLMLWEIMTKCNFKIWQNSNTYVERWKPWSFD